MKSICFAFVLLFSFSAVAKSDPSCLELKSEQLRLALTGSNLGNIHSTRTPEGGPYKPYVIKGCSDGGCDVQRDGRAPLLKYEPSHPDANMDGYVAYPNIDQKAEYAVFNMTAAKLKILASLQSCGARLVIDNGNTSFALRYQRGAESDVKEDIFNLDDRHQVISWMREDLKGSSRVINFSSEGGVVSYSQTQE